MDLIAGKAGHDIEPVSSLTAGFPPIHSLALFGGPSAGPASQMPAITLPDGSQRRYENPVTVAQVASDIGPGLAKAALAGKVDGKLVDTSYVIDRDAAVSIVTARDPEGLEILRHSTAHLLAQAVQSIYPDAQVTIGPVI
jgi:threonyl-tRNA synthetase